MTGQSTRLRRKKGCVIPTWECFNNTSSDLSDMHVHDINEHHTTA